MKGRKKPQQSTKWYSNVSLCVTCRFYVWLVVWTRTTNFSYVCIRIVVVAVFLLRSDCLFCYCFCCFNFFVLASDVRDYSMFAFCCTFKCFDWRLFIIPLKLFVGPFVSLHSFRKPTIEFKTITSKTTATIFEKIK